jgi:Ca2+-binding EF-hand superfamily protein
MNGCIYIFGPTFKFEDANEVTEMADYYAKGKINFSSWLMGSVLREKLLSKEKIEAMFKLIDKDGNKSINADKLYSAFGLGGDIE